MITTDSKKARVADLGLCHGAGDENRTRALSLGSGGAGVLTCPLTWLDSLLHRWCECLVAPLLTVVVRSYGHAVGTGPKNGGRGVRANERGA